MKKIFYLSILLLIFSCNNNPEKVNSDYLEFYYLRPGMRTPYDYSCEMISKKSLGNNVNFKKINNKTDFDRFMKLYRQYKPAIDSGSINTRIKVFIHHKNKIDTLCLGENFNTYKNGARMQDNKELLILIKEITNFNGMLPDFVKKNPNKYGIKNKSIE